MRPLLNVQNLDVTLEAQGKLWKVVRDVSFSLNKGEKLGIVGESGSGKTILARTIIQLLPPSMTISSGKIEYQDFSLSSASEEAMLKIRGKEIGMVFQDPMTFLNPCIKIGKQIAEGYLRHFPQTSSAEVRRQVLELLQKSAVSEPELRLNQYPHELSGGLRQRVLIALAVAAHPRLLIADEPTTALDLVTQAQVLQLFDNFLEEDKSMILITHDLSIAVSFCDRVIVMYAGQIVEDAPIEALFSTPKHPYTRLLFKSMPRLDSHEKLEAIPGSPPNLFQSIKGCPFAPRCPHAFEPCTKHNPQTVGTSHKNRCFLHTPAWQEKS